MGSNPSKGTIIMSNEKLTGENIAFLISLIISFLGFVGIFGLVWYELGFLIFLRILFICMMVFGFFFALKIAENSKSGRGDE